MLKTFICICFLGCSFNLLNAQSCYLDNLNDGKALYNAGNYEDALKDFNAAKYCPDAAPDGEEINRWVSRTINAIKIKKSKTTKSTAETSNDTPETSNDYLYYRNNGMHKLDSKNDTGALNDLTKAIELNPNDSTSYYWRAVTEYHLRDYRRAIDDYTKAIQLSPNDAYSYCNRGLAKYYLEDLTGAIGDYTRAIQLYPANADFYNLRGDVESETDDQIDACNDFKKSCDLGNIEGCTKYKNGCKALQQSDENAWAAASTENSLAAFKNYIAAHPQGKYFDEASSRIKIFLNTLPEGSWVGGGKFLFSLGDGKFICVVTPEDLGAFSWDHAKELAAEYRGGGYSDWKLIDTLTLRSIYNIRRQCSCFSYFSNHFYWSSDELNENAAYYEDLDSGVKYAARKNTKLHVILFRIF
jgi:tetratricopeptide (TPR) repeat protein